MLITVRSVLASTGLVVVWKGRMLRVGRLIMTPAWLAGVALLRLIRPVIHVRLGGLNAGRLGHLVMDQEMFLSERDCGIHSTNRSIVDIRYVWTGGLPVSNSILLEMWRAKFSCGPAWLLQPIDTWNRRIPGGEAHAIPYRSGSNRRGSHILNQHNDLHGVLARTQPHISLGQEQINEARSQIARHGFDPTMKTVCLHVRDSSYFRRHGANFVRDGISRNASIETYRPAVTYLANQGYLVIRLGSEVSDPLGVDHPRVWDYALDDSRTELLDIYLPSVCEFFISTLSGPDKIAQLFRRPILFTNLAPLNNLSLWMKDSLVIPKRLEMSDSGQTLTWPEVFLSELYAFNATDLEPRGIRFVDNSAQEILDVSREMHLRQNALWQPTTDEEGLQAAFLCHVPEHLKAGGIAARIGTNFLRSTRALFE